MKSFNIDPSPFYRKILAFDRMKMSELTKKDFDEMRKILSNMLSPARFFCGKRIYTIEEHNKMLAYAIKYPNSANVMVYFLYIKSGICSVES